MSESAQPPTTPKKKMSLGAKIFLGFIVLIIVSAIAGSRGGDNSVSALSNGTDQTSGTSTDSNFSDTPTPIIEDTSWIPTGFNDYGGGIAWRWGSSSETRCTYDTGSCWSVMVIAKYGCPNGLYAEIAILDKSDIQIDYTNDTSTNVPPMQKVRLTFDTFNDAAYSARLSKLDCTS